MSSQPAANAATTGISKSAAKKRAKKAAKALAASREGSAAAGAAASDDFASAPSSALDAKLAFSAAAGPYPDAASFNYYDDAADAHLHPATAGLVSSGPRQDQFSFASYAFGDRNLVPQANGSPFGGLSQSINITHEDLLETANELWKRMGETAYGEDDPYWSSLPPHVRQFIREAIPFNGLSNTSNDPQATQKDLYAMAQRIVHAASQGMGLQGVGSNLLSQVNGRASHLQPSIAEDLGFHRHPDAAAGQEDDFEDEEEFEEEHDFHVQPNGDTAPKKKNKKKKKKNTSSANHSDPPPAALPPPAVRQPPRQPVPPQPPVQQPSLNPPPPPVTPVPTQPPPSSRAAGKQPMTHAPAPTANPVPRSVRAAGKAPVSASAHTHHHAHAPSSKSVGKGKAAASQAPTKVWQTASAEEREHITEFWLGLSDAERRDLLQIEKDAVLRRMKEQQRHSCSCAVCGRKKVNIEKELDQLYEQYYEELERYTALQRNSTRHPDCPPPPGAGPFPGSVELDPSGQLLKFDHLAPNPAHQHNLDSSDEYDDEDYDDEDEDLDDDDIASDDVEVDFPLRKGGSKPLGPKGDTGDDFFGFGSSLATIKGIITVADDLLKNDGMKFLEMMEQLAVKRVAREELNIRELQNLDINDVQEETDEDDDDDDISESQRVNEGRRMFAIFAARMFEQRVLQAYRERVAKQREEQLLRELEMEEEGKRAKEEKKAKEAQKKKDKKR